MSFYGLPVKDTKRDVLFPPVLRPEVKRLESREGAHVLVYQTSPTFRRLLEPLRRLHRPVIIYGMSPEPLVDGNLTFKPFDSFGILEDLASCAYAVVNGGHNLICEALYYRKPILCFPVARLFEQFLNAFHVRELGYGDFSTSQNPTLEIFQAFESRLETYRASIEKAETDGTDLVVQRLNEIILEETKRRGSRDEVRE